MTKPLAVVFYESLLPGTRLVNRLTDLGYRVQTVTVAQELAATLLREPPMVLVAQLNPRGEDLPAIVAGVKANPSLAHLPVIGYLPPRLGAIESKALAAGVNLVAAETAVLDQLPQLLEHALAVV